MNGFDEDQPAYEFPTGDADVRLLARKLRTADRWLIAAWAAAGEERAVTVDIPILGTVSRRARPDGAVYEAVRAEGRPALKLVEEDSQSSGR